MSSPISKVIALGAILAFTSGCGTVYNFRYERDDPHTRKIFGGVREDADAVFSNDRCVGSFLGLVDLPFSFIGDLVTLPWTIHAIRERQAGF